MHDGVEVAGGYTAVQKPGFYSVVQAASVGYGVLRAGLPSNPSLHVTSCQVRPRQYQHQVDASQRVPAAAVLEWSY